MSTQQNKPITETVASELQKLHATYVAAVSGLESERAALEQESAAILKAADELKLLLPAKAREAERAADALLLAGKHEEAKAKIAEQQQAEAAPAEMEQRRSAIAVRVVEIDGEKRTIARRVFQEWFPSFREPLVEAQRELCTALDNAWADIQRFAQETETGGLPRPLVTENTRLDLTARERGEEKLLFNRLLFWFDFGGRR